MVNLEGDDLVVSLPEARDARRHVGQFFTPEPIAEFMAAQLDVQPGQRVRLLDAGAGAGALTAAFVARWSAGVGEGSTVDAVESDEVLATRLATDLPGDGRIAVRVHHVDFLTSPQAESYTHALLNPPYRRLFSHHDHWDALRGAGINVPNLYAAFIWAALDQLEDGGQLLAIVPRSFCNGSRFSVFRRFLREHASIERVHVFDSRIAVFTVDRVLQETIVVGFRKRPQAARISMSWTSGQDTSDIRRAEIPASRMLDARSSTGAFRIPASPDSAEQTGLEVPPKVLPDRDVSVGSVVDFRLQDRLRLARVAGAVPLVDSRWRPIHLRARPGTEPFARWLVVDDRTRRYVLPVGNYVVVKRVSPKEQRQRLRVRVLTAEELAGYDGVAFENHVCFVHAGGSGLTGSEAVEIAEELGTLRADEYLRELSGSTQINVTDIRALLWGPAVAAEGNDSDGRLARREHGPTAVAPDDHLDPQSPALQSARS